MIRRAAFSDIPRLTELMGEMHQRSIYRDLSELDVRETKSTFVQAIQRDGLKSAGGTIVLVGDKAGVAQSFILGVLSRVYGVGVKLMATDMWFYASDGADPRDMVNLWCGLESWAEANRNVIEIKPGITDALGNGWDRLARYYERRGYRQCGVIFQKVIQR